MSQLIENESLPENYGLNYVMRRHFFPAVITRELFCPIFVRNYPIEDDVKLSAVFILKPRRDSLQFPAVKLHKGKKLSNLQRCATEKNQAGNQILSHSKYRQRFMLRLLSIFWVSLARSAVYDRRRFSWVHNLIWWQSLSCNFLSFSAIERETGRKTWFDLFFFAFRYFFPKANKNKL